MQDVEKRWKIWVAAVLCGLSLLTRYSSAAFLGAGGLVLLLFRQPRNTKRVWIDLLGFGFIGILPMLIWGVYDVLATSTLASRSMEADLAGRLASFWPMLRDVILVWFAPDSFLYTPPYPAIINHVLVPLVTVVLVIISGLFVFRRFHLIQKQTLVDDGLFQLAVLLMLFILLYTVLIFGVYLTTYPPITIGSRMFSPVHLAALWLVVLLLGLSRTYWPKLQRLQPIFLICLILFAGSYIFRSYRIVRQNYEEGLGYLSRTWQQSETVQAVKQLPDNILIVTNETNAMLFLTGRLTYPLEEIYKPAGLDEFSTYGSGDLTDDESQRLFKDNGAALVLFDTIDDQLLGLYADRTAERISSLVDGLYRAYRGADGGIFYYQKP